jgi:hypothetical protein
MLRRTLPAIAVAIVSFLTVRLSIEGWVRYQHYLAPLHKSWAIGAAAPPGEPSGYISASGLTFTTASPAASRSITSSCKVTQTDPRSLQTVSDCLRHHHVLQYAIYQPATRFWTFQAIETSIFATLRVSRMAGSKTNGQL